MTTSWSIPTVHTAARALVKSAGARAVLCLSELMSQLSLNHPEGAFFCGLKRAAVWRRAGKKRVSSLPQDDEMLLFGVGASHFFRLRQLLGVILDGVTLLRRRTRRAKILSMFPNWRCRSNGTGSLICLRGTRSVMAGSLVTNS